MKNTLSKIEELYTKNLMTYGACSKSVGWNSDDCHKLRFRKLCTVISDTNTPFTLNDLGCGYGGLLDYLRAEKANCSQFIGTDISQAMLDKAIEKFGQTETTMWIKNNTLTTSKDYSIASGIFNVRFESSNNDWEKNILATLQNLNQFSQKGFSFNLLTAYVDYKVDHLYYGDPCFYFDYCKKNFSKFVTLHHDYPLWEWTITVHKHD